MNYTEGIIQPYLISLYATYLVKFQHLLSPIAMYSACSYYSAHIVMQYIQDMGT